MIGALLLALASAVAPVELRGAGLAPIDGPIERVDIAGVAVGGDRPRLIGWHEIKRITGDHAEAGARFADISDKAWRARTRLARGDARLAEPLFEELFPRFLGVDSPTSLVVAEGLLRCRLESADRAGALAPWLEAVRLRRAGRQHPADAERQTGAAIDPISLLAPAMPPVWLDTPDARELAAAAPIERDDEVAAALGAWYAHGARLEVAESAGAPPGAGPNDAAVAFVAQIVRSRSRDASERRAVREALTAGLERDFGTWREAWRRAAVGRSLLLEPDAADRRRGLLHLVHLPVRFSASQPHLAAIALAEASAEFARAGDAGAAAALRAELLSHDPYHPAVQWLDRRLAEAPRPARTGGNP